MAALIPKAEIEGEIGDSHVATQARLMSQALRKLTAAIGRTQTIVIFINQIRMKIGVMFGNPETTPGGRALKFYSSVRLDIRRISAIKEGDTIVGNRVRAKVVKNKVAAPFRESEFDIMFESGISAEGDLIDLAISEDLVQKSGAWFSYDSVRLGQGRENAKQFLIDNPDILKELREKVVDKRLPKQLEEDAAAVSADGESGESQASAADGKPVSKSAKAVKPGKPAKSAEAKRKKRA